MVVNVTVCNYVCVYVCVCVCLCVSMCDRKVLEGESSALQLAVVSTSSCSYVLLFCMERETEG